MREQASQASNRELAKAIAAATLYFREGWSQDAVAQQLDVSTATVSRLLARAQEVIRWQFIVPPDVRLSSELVARYKLVDAVVVETGGGRLTTEVLGTAAAEYFNTHVQPHQRVGISCGNTMLQLIQNLPHRSTLPLELMPLSIETDWAQLYQSPQVLVGMLQAKLENSTIRQPELFLSLQRGDPSSFHEAHLALIEEAARSHWFFLGIGTGAPNDANQSFVRIANQLTAGEYASKALEHGVAGEVNNQAFTASGQDVLELLAVQHARSVDHYFLNLLPLTNLRQIASRQSSKPGISSQRVVGVAGGKQKRSAIRAALGLGLINVLITDRRTAKSLLSPTNQQVEPLEFSPHLQRRRNPQSIKDQKGDVPVDPP